jgi:hypothetical protein
MSKNLVTVVGEQALSTLLAVRYLNPAEVLLVGARDWHGVSQDLQNLLGQERTIHLTEARDAHDPQRIYRQVGKKLRKVGWSPENTIYDISGGNRPMAFATFALARDHGGELIDVEYVRHNHRLRRYKLDGQRFQLEEDVMLPALITIADYLNAHAPGFEADGFARDKRGRVNAGGKFESAIYQTLEPHVDEILAGVRPGEVSGQIEIDLVVRCGNNVGLMEAKTGVNKAGIDQLDTAGNPSYMGRYATKFLVTGRYLPRAHKSLALAQDIHVVELPGYTTHHGIPDQEKRRLIQAVRGALGEKVR